MAELLSEVMVLLLVFRIATLEEEIVPVLVKLLILAPPELLIPYVLLGPLLDMVPLFVRLFMVPVL